MRRVVSSAVLERRPVVAHLEPWMVDYERWQLATERGRAKQVTDPVPLLTLQNKASGGKAAAQSKGAATTSSSSDNEALFEQLRQRYNTTPADTTGDTRTLLRALSRRLYLLVFDTQQKTWRFPSAVAAPHDTSLRAAAERALTVEAANLSWWVFGNAPAGWCSDDDKHSASAVPAPQQQQQQQQQQKNDAKKKANAADTVLHVKQKTPKTPLNEQIVKGNTPLRFYFRGEIVFDEAGRIPDVSRIKLPSHLSDYAWLTREELIERLPTQEAEACKKMLQLI